jgi:predicted nucleic acid-binding protein
VAEVFQGLRRDKGRDALRRFFGEMVFLEPAGIGAYFRAAEIYASLRRRGLTVRSTIDCLVAALAEESECHVLAKDRDLDVILASGLVSCGRWRFEPGRGQ